MMIKKLFIALLCLAAIESFGQNGFFKVNFGYGLPTFSSQVETFYSTRTDDLNAKVKQEGFSLGNGLYFGASMGYFFSSNIGFDIGFQYHKGFKHLFTQETLILTTVANLERTIYGNRVLLHPSFIIRTEPAILTPYMKIGPAIGFINQKFHDKLTVGDKVTEQTWIYTGPASWGFYSAIGLNYLASEKVSVFLELNLIAMSYTPERCDMKISTKDGIRNDDALEYFEKHYVFVEWTEDEFNQGQQDPAQPVYMNLPVFSYHSLNFLVGAYFKL